MPRPWGVLAAIVLAAAATTACHAVSPPRGGGETSIQRREPGNPADVALPEGYTITLVTEGLTFPTGVAIDDQGRPHVVEAGYSYGEKITTPRLLRVEPDGRTTVIVTGQNNGPWTGVAFAHGAFFVAEGGEFQGGRILRIAPDGSTRAIVTNLPSLGDHHTNGPAIGPDGQVYFGQGTATNSGVVGPDNLDYGWLARFPDFHDIPCEDVTLEGVDYRSRSELPGRPGVVETGAYSPYGTPTTAGQVIRGRVPCSGAVMRVSPQGGPIELVAWGFRNPFGLAFSREGKLFVTDNGMDERGSRGAFGAGDALWEVVPGAWYGWPDHAEGKPITSLRFEPPGQGTPRALLRSWPGAPPTPRAIFRAHSAANGLDFSRHPTFGHVGQAFVALFGDMAPVTGTVLRPVGFKVVRVDPETGVIEDFAANRGGEGGPASRLRSGGLERPVAVRFDPAGTSLYVVDFGVLTVTDRGPLPSERTGALWRIDRIGER